MDIRGAVVFIYGVAGRGSQIHDDQTTPQRRCIVGMGLLCSAGCSGGRVADCTAESADSLLQCGIPMNAGWNRAYRRGRNRTGVYRCCADPTDAIVGGGRVYCPIFAEMAGVSFL